MNYGKEWQICVSIRFAEEQEEKVRNIVLSACPSLIRMHMCETAKREFNLNMHLLTFMGL